MSVQFYPGCVALAILALQTWLAMPVRADGPLVLDEAVANFEARYRSDPVSRREPELTGEEVKAAVLLFKSKRSELPRKVWEQLDVLTNKSLLPASMNLFLEQQLDPGGSTIFDVWNVQLVATDEDGKSWILPIRNRVIGARSIAEEIARLEAKLAEPDAPGYSTIKHEYELRLKQLIARAKDIVDYDSELKRIQQRLDELLKARTGYQPENPAALELLERLKSTR